MAPVFFSFSARLFRLRSTLQLGFDVFTLPQPQVGGKILPGVWAQKQLEIRPGIFNTPAGPVQRLQGFFNFVYSFRGKTVKFPWRTPVALHANQNYQYYTIDHQIWDAHGNDPLVTFLFI